jgi:hypothetical protein
LGLRILLMSIEFFDEPFRSSWYSIHMPRTPHKTILFEYENIMVFAKYPYCLIA